MSRKRNRQRNARIASDLGTPETRRRCTPDPLLSTDVAVHRAAAGWAIRQALEEGLGASAIDLVRIGLGGGSQGFNPDGWTPQESLMDARWWLRRWRSECARLGLRHDLAEMWASGLSVRQVAAATGTNRPKASAAVEEAIDFYADLRGFRRAPGIRPRIAVWEHGDAPAIRAEAGYRKAEITNRNVRGN